jgi:spore coat protein U-like protein
MKKFIRLFTLGNWRRLLLAPIILWANASHAVCTAEVTNVEFGGYDVFTAQPLDGIGSIRMVCPFRHWVTYTIQIGPGNGSFLQREMHQGNEVLRYNLYTDSGRSLIWGDGTSGSRTVYGQSTLGTSNRYTIYGRIPPGQNVLGGVYTDIIYLTVEY